MLVHTKLDFLLFNGISDLVGYHKRVCSDTISTQPGNEVIHTVSKDTGPKINVIE